MQLRARIGTILLAIAVAAGLVYGFAPRPVPVDTAAVIRGPLAETVEEEGRTRVKDRYVIAAPVTGLMRRITFKVGDGVRAGQVLAVIEPRRSDALDPRSRLQAEAQVQAAKAALGAAEENARAAIAQAGLAQEELVRAESLYRSAFISPQALDKARTEATRAQAARLAAEHAANVARFELKTARAALAQAARLPVPGEVFPVRAPVDASVLKLVRESEGTVLAGEPLLEIGNPLALEVEVEVLSTQAVKILPGAKVLLDRWGGEATLQGMVRVVEPAGFTKISALGVEEQRVRVIVDFTSPREQWRRLGDGYRVEARFVVWEDPAVLQIPASALFRHDNGWAVFVVEKARAKLKPVEIGHRAGLVAQVVSGLAVGETVISHPDDKVRDGVRVKARQP
jgi:HlyD family secretion protein